MSRSYAKEDYLDAIYILHQRYYAVRSVDLASYLQVTRATVSSYIRRLAADELIHIDEKKHLLLTDEGTRRAERVYRRFDYWRRYLISRGVDEKAAEREAFSLGRAMGDLTFDILSAEVGF